MAPAPWPIGPRSEEIPAQERGRLAFLDGVEQAVVCAPAQDLLPFRKPLGQAGQQIWAGHPIPFSWGSPTLVIREAAIWFVLTTLFFY